MGYYKKYGVGIITKRVEIDNKYRVLIVDFDANPHDKEAKQYGLIVEDIRAGKIYGSKAIIYEKDYKTFRGVVRAFRELVEKLI